ncbi:putative IgGFc-binding protein-like isoform X1 [Apostichopus japonicus]|uniref:Putative IgGFc-binding protein-like isoform X1 n=1 Tax=Stichopus japonicus TaxID=307972 RepID=A0A2G8KQQ9_STIJA|nr:putative IgGFc-binding protein-like isoform X1 [Apostichopus japonicus]
MESSELLIDIITCYYHGVFTSMLLPTITVKTAQASVVRETKLSANDWLNTIGPEDSRLPINMRPLFYFLVVCLQAAEDYGSSESFYPLPVTLLGTEYYVVTPSGVYSYYYPTFSVTSIYDDTRVLIFFNQQYGDYNSTHPMEVILNSLSTYVWQLSFDFTGTRITASKVVSVSSGHECANYDSSVTTS